MGRQIASLTLEEIIERCETAGIPFSPIARPEDLFEDPQLNDGQSLVAARLPDGRRTKLPKLPLALDEQRFELRLEAPVLGAHTRTTLRELGYDDTEVDALHQAEIVVAGE